MHGLRLCWAGLMLVLQGACGVMFVLALRTPS
jgi:hypothetical protein